MCVRAARGDAQAKYPLDEQERLIMDAYLRERVEVRKWTGSHAAHYVEPIESIFEVQ